MSDEKKIPPAKAVVDSSIKLFRTYVDAANKLPTGDDYDYHSVFPGFVEVMSDHKKRLDAIITAFSNAAVNPSRQRKLLAGAESRNRTLDVVDMMFENIDTLLDEVHGAKMSAEAQNAAFSGQQQSVLEADDDDNADPVRAEAARHSRSFAASSSGPSSAAGTTLARKTPLVAVARPQLSFARAVDNSDAPFRPLIFNNATGELSYGTAGVHPHKALIEGFTYAPSQLRYREELLPAPLSAANLHFVTSVADLDAMIEDHLAKSKEIAIDLEHHDAHSYQGITCLMQISTRSDDFLVDVFPLRDHLHRLNKVLLDTSIVKVLHGCKEDVRWLQKDFGCYIANLFDTGAALQTLHMPHSLAFAVDHYCQVKLNKQYQKADWRARPLPADMAHYARQDTHFLLYIYDRLSNQLLQQEGGRAAVLGNLLVHVLNESRQLCLLQYEKPHFEPTVSFRDGLGKGLLGLTAAQTERARLIYNWRERAAQAEDESPLAVMHPSSIVQLATSLAFSKAHPPTATQLLRSIYPLSMAVRSQIKGLVDVLANSYADDEEHSAAAASAAAAAANAAANKAGEAGASAAVQRRHVRHYPLTGTLPSVVARNNNPAGHVFEADEGSSAAKGVPAATIAFSSAPAAASDVFAAQRASMAAMASLYAGVLPPTSPCLAKKPVAAAGLALDSVTDSFGIVRPAAAETLLQKAIRAEKANTALGLGGATDANAADDDAPEALPEELTFAKDTTAEEEAAKAKEEKEAAEKRARDESNAEIANMPISLKDQYGLGRAQRKKAHRKE